MNKARKVNEYENFPSRVYKREELRYFVQYIPENTLRLLNFHSHFIKTEICHNRKNLRAFSPIVFFNTLHVRFSISMIVKISSPFEIIRVEIYTCDLSEYTRNIKVESNKRKILVNSWSVKSFKISIFLKSHKKFFKFISLKISKTAFFTLIHS